MYYTSGFVTELILVGFINTRCEVSQREKRDTPRHLASNFVLLLRWSSTSQSESEGEREREREREGENTADYDGLNFFVVRFVPASRITNSGV